MSLSELRFLPPVTLQAAAPDPSAQRFAAAAVAVDSVSSVLPSAVPSEPAASGAPDAIGFLLTTRKELPEAPRRLVRTLLLLLQAMYLGFYFGALANLGEIHDIFLETREPHPVWLMSLLVVTATALIPVRLFLFSAVALD